MRSEPRLGTGRSDAGTRPLVIEFLGTPGAGKTTLAALVVDLLEANGRNAETIVSAARANVARSVLGRMVDRRAPMQARSILLWKLFTVAASVHTIAFAREHRELTSGVVRHQARRRLPIATRGHVVTNFLRLCGRYRYVTSTMEPTGIVVIDDGFAHRSVHLHSSAFEDSDLARVAAYIDRAPAPDVLVVVRASRRTCERRVLERGVWRHSKRHTPAQIGRYLGNAELVAAAAANRARELGWQVVWLDNDGRDLWDVRRDLSDALETIGIWSPQLVAIRCGATA